MGVKAVILQVITHGQGPKGQYLLLSTFLFILPLMTKQFRTDFSSYRFIETDDQSQTLFSEYFNESCHSSTGAVEETLYNYIKGCEILTRAPKAESFTIFEVGFGPGVGALKTFDLLEEVGCDSEIHFISTEIDPGLVEWAKKEYAAVKYQNFPSFSDLELVSQPTAQYYWAQGQNGSTFTIILGDARQAVPASVEAGKLKSNLVNAIYQDPFSPKRNPSLWTVEWFDLLKKISADDCILATYSASSTIRKSMLEAGWRVRNVKGFTGKRSSTRASLQGDEDGELTDFLLRSKLHPLRDVDLE